MTTLPNPDSDLVDVNLEIPDEWYQALGLAERMSPGSRPLDLSRVERDPLRGEWLLRRWRRLADLRDDRRLAGRLAVLGCTRRQLTALLLEPTAELRARLPRPAGWMSDLLIAWQAEPAVSPTDWQYTAPDRQEAAALAGPLVDLHVTWMLAEAAALRDDDLDPIRRLVLRRAHELLGQLQSAVAATVAVERDLASLERQLPAGPAEQRRLAHLAQLARAEHSWALLRAYPVLARDLATICRHWFEATLEWLEADQFDPEPRALGSDPLEQPPADATHDGGDDRMARALYSSRHPDFLGTGLDRDALRLHMLALQNATPLPTRQAS